MLLETDVWHPRPPRALLQRKAFSLPLAEVHPQVHLAHRRLHAHHLTGRRIIFDYEFVLQLRGTGSLHIGSKTYDMNAHQLLLIPPFVPHWFEVHGPPIDDHIAVHFDWAAKVPGNAHYLGRRRPYVVHFNGVPDLPIHHTLRRVDPIEALFDRLIGVWQSSKPWYSLAASSILVQIFLELLKRRELESAVSSRSPSWELNAQRVRAVTEAVRADPASEWDVASMAEVAGLSTSHFMAVFRDHVHMPPLTFLRRTRVEAAQELLREPDIGIKEVARRTGFANAFHFSRVFHAVSGVSASVYRAMASKRGRSDQSPG